MSAGLLREAAAVLRERAEAATPGPWGIGIDDDPRTVSSVDPYNWIADTSGNPNEYMDAAYIATMHPDVGLALADWLDDEAPAVAISIRDTPGITPDEVNQIPAIVLARAILGRDA